MGEMIELKAKDGHRFGAYRAAPKGRARGAIVVIQEIFGVNSHIRGLCDGFVADGYVAIAPALFDRVERNVDLGYTPDTMAKGRDLRGKVTWPDCLADVAASVEAVAKEGRVGIVGYCYGGGVAYAAACSVPGLDAAVGYYGGPWAEVASQTPRCASMLHFAEKDQMIPLSLADSMKEQHPSLIVHRYDADHGFACEQRPMHFNPYATTLARARTMALFAAALD